MNSNQPGQLIILSGPSGVGKSTVVRRLLQVCDLPLAVSVSATSRMPRPGEREGEDYIFLSEKDFQERKQRGEFLEYAEVFGRGEWYGTLEKPVTEQLQKGNIVILEIDVTGAAMVLPKFPNAVTIFVHPGTIDELEKRLRGRGTEIEEDIQRRMEVAETEMETAPQYSHIVKNDNIESTAKRICQLLSKLGEKKSCTTN